MQTTESDHLKSLILRLPKADMAEYMHDLLTYGRAGLRQDADGNVHYVPYLKMCLISKELDRAEKENKSGKASASAHASAD